VQCLGLTGACAASSCWAAACGFVRPRSLACDDSSGRRVKRASCCAHCSAPAFCAWRRLPLISLRLLVCVLVRDGLAASIISIYISAYICVARVLLLLSFLPGVSAPSLPLGDFMFDLLDVAYWLLLLRRLTCFCLAKTRRNSTWRRHASSCCSAASASPQQHQLRRSSSSRRR